MRLVGVTMLAVVAGQGLVGLTLGGIDEQEAAQARLAAEQMIEATTGLRRFVQEHRSALLGTARAVALSELQPGFLDSRLFTGTPQGLTIAFAVLPAADGEPLGYVYLAGSGEDPGGVMRSLELALPESGIHGAETGRAFFGNALPPGLPAPVNGSPVLSTGMMRTASTRSYLSRFREPGDPSATRLSRSLDLGGHRATGAAWLSSRDIRANAEVSASTVATTSASTPRADVDQMRAGVPVSVQASRWAAGAAGREGVIEAVLAGTAPEQIP